MKKPTWARHYLTAQELIDKLKKLPADALVDTDDVSSRGVHNVVLDKHEKFSFAILQVCRHEW